MLYLSELMIQHAELESFDDLLMTIKQTAVNEIHLKIDIKPNYPDTPADWEDKVEGAFSGTHSVMGPNVYKTEDDF
ncbi:MAG: sulfur relay protein DsrC [Gammaproteobacteria bacterium]|nr:sulfur relay protein DsrC [Gammaproteobacteria bacterium]